MEISLAQFGHVIFYLPAGFLVYLSREWVLLSLMKRGAAEEVNTAAQEIDLYAIIAWSFSGFGWGGFCRRGRRDNLFSFLVAQFWFLFLVAIVLLYSRLKGLEMNTFMGDFMSSIVFIGWLGFWLNFIPLPPFDAAAFYIQPLYEIKITTIFLTLWKTVIIVFSYILPVPPFFRGTFLLSWAGLA